MRTLLTRFLCGLALLLAGLPPLHAAIEVTVSGPGGSRSQSLPDEGGSFDVNLPLTRNSQNTITVTAKDAQGRTVEKKVQLTQLALKDVVVASIRSEPLSVERIEELVNSGVIQLDDPENFNVSVFDIVLVIGGQPIPIIVPIVTPIEVQELVINEPVPNPPGGDGSGGSNVQDSQIIVFEFPSISSAGGPGPMRIPGVLVIEGRIKTLKEFYSVRLLLMNVSGFFTLKDVMATIQFPDGGLSSTLPSDGIIAFGDILPGDGASPGQKEREWIVRGDEIGVRRVRIDFGGTLAGPGLPEVDPVAFNGAAETDVEVKGPPRLQVHVNHPDFVVENVPYDITVQITNTSDAPALYSSLDLDVAGAGELVDCSIPDPQTITGCTHLEGPVTRRFGHIFPGQSVLEVFTINPLRSGRITSCIGLSDQNIDLTVSAGVRGCLTGKIPTTEGAPEGIPTVYTTPGNNAQSVSADSPVVAFFSEKILATSITTGSNGTFQVIDQSGYSVPGEMQFAELNGRDIVIWQALYPFPFPQGFLKDNTEYRILLSKGITDLDGNPLFNEYSANFTTTSAINDLDAPTASISIAPPVNPNAVLPGQLITASLYGSDQGSGLALMELRIQDLDTPGALFQLIDKRTILKGSDNPAVFTVDSANLVPGHAYMLKGTVYDRRGNVRESTIGLFIAASAEAPVVVLPPDPALPILRGVALTLKPQAITGAVRKVEYFLDGAPTPVATVFSAPFQTTLGTLALSEGAHTVTAVGTDPLGQTASDSLDFVVGANLNEPLVAFTGTQDGIALLRGTRLQVNGSASDPLGIASVAFYLNSTNTAPLATNTAPFSVDIDSLPAGNHSILLVAENTLGVRNSLSNPDSVLTFSVLAPAVGSPPPVPVLTLVSHPDSTGEVEVRGTSVAGARVEVRNLDRSYLVTVQAATNGAFAALISAQPGETVEVVAYQLTQSPNPSPAATATVTAAPSLVSIALTPAPLSFTTAFGETRQLTLTAQYDNATSANVTGSALFTTSNPAVASVSPGGNVVANGNGSCDLRAVYAGFTSTVSCVVNVITLTGLVGHPAAINLVYAGEPLQVTARGVYSNGSTNNLAASTVAFATADPAVAVINASGRLTAVADGQTRVIVSRAGFPPAEIPVTINSALNTTPVATVLTPVDGTQVQRGQFVNVQVRAQDVTGGVVRVELDLSGQIIQSDSQQLGAPLNDTTRSFGFSVPALAQLGGTIQLDARAIDAGNRTSAVARVTLTVADLTQPVVVIQSPTNATPYNPGDLIDLEVLATDAGGVTELRYLASDAFSASASSGVFASTSSTNRTFQIPVPFGVPGSNLVLRAIALDGSGNAATSTPVQVVLTGADITPPGTFATATSDPGATAVLTVSYAVTNGLSDLDHVVLYFRRNGIGTFNRYTGPLGNTEGEYVPQSGANGTIVFDSTRMGGDGTFEFYTVGVDGAGNREAAPTAADQARAIAAGTVWTVITSPTTILAGNTSFDNLNIRVQNTTLTIQGSHNFLNVELINNAMITSPQTTATEVHALEFGAWSVSVDATSSIDVSGRGYLGGDAPGWNVNVGQTKPGYTGASFATGGSHGGLGAVYPGHTLTSEVFGDLLRPVDLGGGGCAGNAGQRGGDGGGRMRVVAFNIMADGPILANGLQGNGGFSGSGAGGSILLECATLSGAGLITANGGGRDEAGGGGRIAIEYRDLATKNNTLIQSLGGTGNYGLAGNGTVFLRRAGASNGTLVVDANGQVRPYSGLPYPPGTVFDNIILRNGARVEVNAPIEVAGRLTLENNAVLRHVAEREEGLAISATHVEIDATSAIDASAMGYPGGRSGSNATNNLFSLTLHRQRGGDYLDGGSYGGVGGRYSNQISNMPVYGVPWAPVYLGSGGGPSSGGTRSGNGGGRVDIEATGSVTVNGAIRVNGENGLGSFGSSGSGGSVWIRTSLFKGTGVIQANGGGNDQAGGGGRIAVEYAYTDALADFADFTSITAISPGANFGQGSAGTVWLKQGSQDGHLIVDNQRGSPNYNYTPLSPLGFGSVQASSVDTLVLDPAVPTPLPGALVGAWLQPDELNPTLFEVLANTRTTLTVRVTGPALNAIAAPGDRYSLRHRFQNITLRGGAVVELADAVEVAEKVLLSGQSIWTHAPAATNTFPYLLVQAGMIEVQADSRFDVTGRGSPGGIGTGRGFRLNGLPGAMPLQGGGHGGYGGGYPGYPTVSLSHGDPVQPVDYGGGGGGGNANNTIAPAGGGRIRLIAGEIQMDGNILADGGNGVGSFTGGGAGGSIWINATRLSGTGLIRASGGTNDEGGGGGRIALHVQDLDLPLANVQARSRSANFAQGGHGTVFVKTAAHTVGDLIVDGGGFTVPADSTPYPGGITWDNLTFTNGVRVVSSNEVHVTGAFSLAANATLTQPATLPGGLRVETGQLSVDATSAIDVSGRGYAGGYSGSQTGNRIGQTKPGRVGSEHLCGGSHGGVGGWYNNNDPSYGPPGPTYGNPRQPVDFGGGGGAYNSINTPGGFGGGALRLIADSVLVHGALRANGANGNGGYTAGGAGGSIWINADSVTGTGQITANGGGGDESGGGGRVAVHAETVTMTLDQIQASSSGSNFGNGGAGTLYFQSSGMPSGRLVVDGRAVPTNGDRSVYPNVGPFQEVLFRRNAQVVATNTVRAAGQFRVESSSYLTHPNLHPGGLRIEAGTAEVDSTSRIDVSGRGYYGGFAGVQAGNRVGQTKPGFLGSERLCGGSHGGVGGWYNNQDPSYGPPGAAYGDARQPVDFGAGGGAYNSANTPAGNGGGAIRLISGSVLVDGGILANGANGGGGYTGGGAGGSIWITAPVVSGSGTLSANGGGGDESGGGGRVAVYSANMQMAVGQVQASSSGSNFGNGGAGTLYFESPADPDGHLVIDARGVNQFSERTAFPDEGIFSRVTLRNRAQVSASVPVRATGLVSLEANSYISHPEEQLTGLSIESGSFNLDSTSSIDVSGRGYPGGYRGSNTNSTGVAKPPLIGSGNRSGGSHGGLGRAFPGAFGPPNVLYGDALQPVDLGAGGGANAGSINNPGGAGGGAVRIITGTATVAGQILANGQNGGGGIAGAGAGGSVWINATDFSGSGAIRANGGGGDVAGGGGRIAVYYVTSSFSPASITASGAGGNYGGTSDNGTVTLQAVLPGLADAHAGAGLRIARIEVLPNGRMKVHCNGDVAGCRVHLEKAGSTDAASWTPLGFQTADGTGVVFELPVESGSVFLRLRME